MRNWFFEDKIQTAVKTLNILLKCRIDSGKFIDFTKDIRDIKIKAV